MTWAFAAGGLVSSVTDLARWDAALYTEKVLPKDYLEQMWTPAKLNNGEEDTYGFGWFIFGDKNHRLVIHDGGISGFLSSTGRWVDDRTTVIVLMNGEGRDYVEYQIAQGIARRCIPRLVTKPIEDTVPLVTAKLLAALTSAISGALDPERFTDAARIGFFPEEAARLRTQMKELGPIKSFLLLKKKDHEKAHDYSYRSGFAKDSLLLDATLNEEGKFTAFDVEFE